MKKTTKILIFTFVGILLIGISICILVACLRQETFTKKEYTIENKQIQSVTLQVKDREVDITTTTDNAMHIDYFDSTKEYLDIALSQNGDLAIQLLSKKNWLDFIGTKPAIAYRKIQVQIPATWKISCFVHTTNADIKVQSLAFRRATLHANGGNILCENVAIENSIYFTAKNGNILASIVGKWEDFSIACTIKKGTCNLPLSKTDGSKFLSANCNNGNIQIAFV